MSDEEIIKAEKKIFDSKKEQLLEKYEDKYVAMINGEVVDSDKEFSDLAKRVYETHGYKAIFMSRVTRHEKVHRIPSVKLKK